MNSVFRCKAIFFDAGQTLFRPHPSVGEIYARTAARYGVVQPAGHWESRFHARWKASGGLAALGGPANPGLEKRWWRDLVKHVFVEMAGKPDFDAFFEELYHTFGHGENWRLYPEVTETLRALKSRGFTLGIISNWDSRLMALCQAMDLECFFDFILISAVFGHSKPGEKIFQEALRKAGCRADEALHVGDSYEEDYRAALAAGLHALYLNRGGRHAREARTIENLSELLPCVEPVSPAA